MASAVVERTSRPVPRRRASLPRRVFIGLCVLLSLLGVKTIVRGTPAPIVRAVAPANGPARAALPGFAEAFARAYLTWDATRPQDHVDTLRPFLGGDVDQDAGLPVPATGSERVDWTATVDQVDTDPGRAVVTVAVAVDGTPALRYLAVPVRYTRAGALAVSDYPALVGRPAPDAQLAGRSGDDVRDGRLAAVVHRALGNYLAGAVDNLRADVAPGAQLSPPSSALTLKQVLSLQWAGDAGRRVSVVVVASDRQGVAYTLRYELAVVKRDRWYVAEINPPMSPGKDSA